MKGGLNQKNGTAMGKQPGIGEQRLGNKRPPEGYPGVGKKENKEENQG